MKWILGIIALVLLGTGAAWWMLQPNATPPPAPLAPVPPTPKVATIGKSVEGRDIVAYTYGSGKNKLLFVGGMHGGYEWNSVLLAYTFMDYFSAHPEVIPSTVTVTVVPSANPDGVYKVVGKEGRFGVADTATTSSVAAAGRFNAHQVDLNRNFDCKWQATSTWQSKPVSAGTAAFSEPEAQAIRDFVRQYSPSAVVFWHSQANAVYASECTGGILPGTLGAMDAYATAAGYPAIQSFDAYPITGDAEGWLASQNIPAITVELATHETIEWEKNLAGVNALLRLYTHT